MLLSFLLRDSKQFGGVRAGVSGRRVAGLGLVLGLLALCAPPLTHGQTLPSLPTQIATRTQPADITISSRPTGFRSDHRTVVGDFDGDGVADLLVTSDTASTIRNQAGEAYVIYGSRTTLLPSRSIIVDKPKNGADLTIVGQYELAVLGINAAVGDLNGDGIDDIILSGEIMRYGPYSIPIGAMYVIFGSANRRVGKIDLAETAADVTISTEAPGQPLMPALAVGDINGDGFNDLLFSHWRAGPPPLVHVMLGPLSSNTVINLSQTSTDITFIGGGENDGFGRTISCADVDGDGTADILIGRTGAGRDGNLDAGELDIFFGSSNLKPGVEISLHRDGVGALVKGAAGGVDYGFGTNLGIVLTTGDINNDGIQDILLGVPSFVGDGSARFAGDVYVIFGSPSLRGKVIDMLLNQQDVTIRGADVNTLPQGFGDGLGMSIATGDFNGDGVTDMLIGAPFADGLNNQEPDSGEAYVILGSSQMQSGTTIEIAKYGQDITLLGKASDANLGIVVARGDLNADGVSDLIVQASNSASASGQDSVVVYVYFGGPIRPPQINKAKFKEGKSQLLISGTDFTGDVRIEINGVIINREVTFLAEEGQLILKGTRQELNLVAEANQVVVIRKGTRSNLAKVKG